MFPPGGSLKITAFTLSGLEMAIGPFLHTSSASSTLCTPFWGHYVNLLEMHVVKLLVLSSNEGVRPELRRQPALGGTSFEISSVIGNVAIKKYLKMFYSIKMAIELKAKVFIIDSDFEGWAGDPMWMFLRLQLNYMLWFWMPVKYVVQLFMVRFYFGQNICFPSTNAPVTVNGFILHSFFSSSTSCSISFCQLYITFQSRVHLQWRGKTSHSFYFFLILAVCFVMNQAEASAACQIRRVALQSERRHDLQLKDTPEYASQQESKETHTWCVVSTINWITIIISFFSNWK